MRLRGRPSSGIGFSVSGSGLRIARRTLDADDIALVLRLRGRLHLVRQLVHVQLLVGALELPVPALSTQVALLLRLRMPETRRSASIREFAYMPVPSAARSSATVSKRFGGV